ncbi:MAG: hypothetical protein ACOH13_11120 [Flavobacteriales bacterium]
MPKITSLVLYAHALYLLIGGAWPLLSLRTFEEVTGPKSDHFLVRTVALILVLVASILFTQRKPPVERSAVFTAMGISCILGSVALFSAAGGWVWKVYFIDGGMHLLFASAWVYLLLRHQVPFRTDRAH